MAVLAGVGAEPDNLGTGRETSDNGFHRGAGRAVFPASPGTGPFRYDPHDRLQPEVAIYAEQAGRIFHLRECLCQCGGTESLPLLAG